MVISVLLYLNEKEYIRYQKNIYGEN